MRSLEPKWPLSEQVQTSSFRHPTVGSSPLQTMLNSAETDAIRGLRTSLVKEAADCDLSSVAASLQCNFAEPAVGALCSAMG